MNDTYTVYIQTDANGNITAVNSSAFLSDTTGWIKIDEGTGDKYHHAQGNYFEQPIYTGQGICRYHLVDGVTVEKTPEEIAAEEPIVVILPTDAERIVALETENGILRNLASQISTDFATFMDFYFSSNPE